MINSFLNNRRISKKSLLIIISFLLLSLFLNTSFAKDPETVEDIQQLNIKQMSDIQKSLEVKLTAREVLRKSIKTAAADDIPELQSTLTSLNEDLRDLRNTFEQIAIGEVDIDLFSKPKDSIGWREEVAQIMMPLVQNMKRLTEKPRKIESIRSKISLASQQQKVVQKALFSIKKTLNQAEEPKTKEALKLLVQSWTEREKDISLGIESSKAQLTKLQRSDGPLWIRIRDGLSSFAKGRGLTLLLASIAAFSVWFGINLIGKLFSRKSEGEDKKTFRTRQRIVHYGVKAVTGILIIIAMIIVFYSRGDILLMGIAFLLVAGTILGLRNTIPKFIAETRLLLNLGSARENERVMYQGLPWKIAQLNMQSVLKNPEITGTIRLPMEEIMNLVSRPAGKESWFPASKNDYLLMDDGKVLKVMSLTPEKVALESLAGTSSSVSTADFFNASFENLTRSDSFSVTSVFGIGYSHQEDSVVSVPEKFKIAIKAELDETDLSDEVISVSVELQEAGASSLDYWIRVIMKSESASSYFKIRRLIQQVCVKTCTEQSWDIPFPQLTLHRE